jgi:2-dehydropantoate 2-reductase
MNIVVMGAGAIGSLFGALLSKNNNVSLICRKPHASAIKKSGLYIQGKTRLNVKINALTSVDSVKFFPELLILTVKSYDTESAILQAKKIINKDTIVLSLQNGLDNINKIKKYLKTEKIIAGVTTQGAFFSKPGAIKHTGNGTTLLGELNGYKTKRIINIADTFNKAGIKTKTSENILKELWIKAIINSSINPLTALFNCKNGYLLENPILENILERICKESTCIANAYGIEIIDISMIKKTKDVVKDTSENHSSMLQSFLRGKKTEIDSINGKLVEIGKKYGLKPSMNEIMVYSIKSLVK